MHSLPDPDLAVSALGVGIPKALLYKATVLGLVRVVTPKLAPSKRSKCLKSGYRATLVELGLFSVVS